MRLEASRQENVEMWARVERKKTKTDLNAAVEYVERSSGLHRVGAGLAVRACARRDLPPDTRDMLGLL